MSPSPEPSSTFRLYRRYGLATGAASLLITYIQMLAFPTWDIVFAWLIAANLVGFYLFGFDQGLAVTHTRRVPEGLLLAVTLLGGAAGALVARLIFRHQAHAPGFQPAFGLCVLGAGLWIVAYYGVLCPGCR